MEEKEGGRKGGKEEEREGEREKQIKKEGWWGEEMPTIAGVHEEVCAWHASKWCLS